MLTIKEVVENRVPDLQGSCVKITGETSGKGEYGDWSKTDYILEDTSGEIRITAFNDQIGRLDVGNFYKLEGIKWKKNGEYWNTSITKDTNITQEGETQTTPEVKTEEAPKEVPKQTLQILPDISDLFRDFIQTETRTLLNIELEIRAEVKKYRTGLNDPHIGMLVKEIYRESKKTNLTKASKL